MRVMNVMANERLTYFLGRSLLNVSNPHTRVVLSDGLPACGMWNILRNLSWSGHKRLITCAKATEALGGGRKSKYVDLREERSIKQKVRQLLYYNSGVLCSHLRRLKVAEKSNDTRGKRITELEEEVDRCVVLSFMRHSLIYIVSHPG
jgi:hypothetical protein